MYDSKPGLHSVRIYCSDVIQTAILDLAMDHVNSVDGPQGRVRLSAKHTFCALSNTLCGMSHGDQHRPLVRHAVKALVTNVWL